MRSLKAGALLAVLAGLGGAPPANAQQTRVAVFPLVLGDTADQRMETVLRDALVQLQLPVKVFTAADTRYMLNLVSRDTLSWVDMHELGHLFSADFVVGVHSCATREPCVVVIAGRAKSPVSPDTLRIRGPDWLRTATDTLSRRLLEIPSGS